jgi:Spy/CpxP family protein refolding chaperone
MKIRALVITTCLVTVALAPAALLAQGFPGGPGRGGPGGPGHGPGLERLLHRLGDELGLTDTQRDEIDAILAAGQPTVEALREQLVDARQAFRDSNDPVIFDEAAARAFAESQSQLHADLMVETMRLHSQVLSVLTEEQREQLDELRARRGQGRHRRGGKRLAN